MSHRRSGERQTCVRVLRTSPGDVTQEEAVSLWSSVWFVMCTSLAGEILVSGSSQGYFRGP